MRWSPPRRNRAPKVTRSLPTDLHAVLAPGARQIVRNLVVTRDGVVWAGYRVGPARWDFTGDAAKGLLLDGVQDVWATLLGREMQERVTTRPHPVAQWARALDQRTPTPPDAERWNDHLRRMQLRVGQAGMDDKIVYRYFTVGTVEPDRDVMAEVLAYLTHGTQPSDEVRAVLAEEKRVADAVTGVGWRAARMNERDAGWLRARSLAPGIPAPLPHMPDGWAEGDVAGLSNDVRWEETPFDRTVKVTAWRGGKQVVRHVQVLTALRVADLRYPECGLEPWEAYSERVMDPDGRPFGVEWNLVGRLAAGEELRTRAGLDFNKANAIKESYIAFEEHPPEYTERGIAVAREARDQISTGSARDSGRFLGTINLIVWGEDLVRDGRVEKPADEVCEERADAIRRLYGGNDLRMEFTPPTGQAIKLRETIPGEPIDPHGYQRQIRLDWLAAGLPNVSAAVGDGRGPYIGYTRGAARRPVFHDPHFATEGRGVLGRGQNLYIVAATLGGGKSVLLSAIAANAALRGIPVVVRDPSGPMMNLCAMPDLAPHASAINLLHGPPGTLSPPSLVRDPRPEEFLTSDGGPDTAAYEQAAALARGERRALVTDIARRCLEADLYSAPLTREVLRAASDVVAQTTGWTARASLWDLVAGLNGLAEQGGEHAERVARALRAASEMPLLSLLFPPGGFAAAEAGERPPSPVEAAVLGRSLLTVISTPGIRRAPDEAAREDWSPQEMAADPILRLTALFTDRLLFTKQMSERAVAIFDEAEDMTDSGAGRGYLSRLGRDHSKWNIGVYLGLKNVTDEMMGTELRNFVAGAFVGRTASLEPAEAMLRVLNVEDQRYARVLMGLSSTRPGEFVHLDAEGNVGGIKVDVDYWDDLKRVVMTNPENAGSAAWDLEEGAHA